MQRKPRPPAAKGWERAATLSATVCDPRLACDRRSGVRPDEERHHEPDRHWLLAGSSWRGAGQGCGSPTGTAEAGARRFDHRRGRPIGLPSKGGRHGKLGWTTGLIRISTLAGTPGQRVQLQEMVGEARLVVRSRRLNAPRDGKLCPGADRKVQLPAVKAAALASIPLDDVIGRDDVDAIAECGTPSASSHFLQGTTATRVCLPRERPRARGAIDKGERRVDAESRQSLTEAAQAPVLRRRWEQASHNGDLAHAVKDRRIDRDDVTQLGDVLVGTAEGRRSADEITVFDSTGLAIQDLAIALAAFETVEELALPTLEL